MDYGLHNDIKMIVVVSHQAHDVVLTSITLKRRRMDYITIYK